MQTLLVSIPFDIKQWAIFFFCLYNGYLYNSNSIAHFMSCHVEKGKIDHVFLSCSE